MEPSVVVRRAEEFLQLKRIAVVGVSRAERDFSRAIFRELARRGYDVVPVNPAADAIDGRRCFARVQDVSPRVEAALLLTPPQETEHVVQDCLDARVRRLWMHRGGGRGAATARALALCAANDVEPITDLCPFMVLPHPGLPHRVHGFFRKRALVHLALQT